MGVVGGCGLLPHWFEDEAEVILVKEIAEQANAVELVVRISRVEFLKYL